MSYGTVNESREGAAPIQCYLFRYGTLSGEYYAYTNDTDYRTIAHGGSVGTITYEPIPIDRENVVANGTMDKSAIRIGMDIGTDLAELFRVYPPSTVVSLVIYEGHDGDGDFVAVWSGRIVSANREGSNFTVSGEPIITQMKRPGLRRNYQYGCPLVLYGDQCGANKAAATVSATVASLSGATVTLNSGWGGAFSQAKFLRGMIEWTPSGSSVERRSIVRVTGNVLSLSGIPKGLSASDTVSLVLGCNHKAFAPDGDCEGLHNNIQNFGGQPWIPIKNVIKTNPYY